MRYITFTNQELSEYGVCFLSPDLNVLDMKRLYIEPHMAGMEEHILAYSLHKGPKTTPAIEKKKYLGELLPILTSLKTRYLVVCDAEYFRHITKKSAESSLGYVIGGNAEFAGFHIVYCPNFRTVFYNPIKVKAEITRALYALKSHIHGHYKDPGNSIIHFEAYPDTVASISDWLEKLLEMDLTADIETFSLVDCH